MKIIQSDYSHIAERLVKNCSAIEDLKMRTGYFFSKLSLLSDNGVVEVLNYVFHKANRDRGLHSDLLVVFTFKDLLLAEFSSERLNNLLSIAEDKKYFQVLDILSCENDLDKKVVYNISTENPYEYEDTTIGERKSLAHSNDPVILDKLLYDPEPMVIESLLQNPRITEKDVLKLVAKRPNNPAILRVIAKSERWNSSYNLREAIVRNPYTPLDLALKLLHTLMKQHLVDISNDGSLNNIINKTAARLLKGKTGDTEEYYFIEDNTSDKPVA